MPENYSFIQNGDVSLYVRRIRPLTPSKKAILLFNSRSLCVESSMGIPMGSISYGDFTASKGIETFLIDLRGYGLSSSIQEQVFDTQEEIFNPMTIEKYYQDIRSSILYVKNLLGNDTNITIMGFSFLATIVVSFSHLYPNLVDNVVSLNPNWLREKGDPISKVNFFLKENPDEPFIKTSIAAIQKRFLTAQPIKKDFREPLWAEEAGNALKKYHKTFDNDDETWKLHKNIPWADHLTSLGHMSEIRANILFITAEYDIENPFFLVDRFYNKVNNNGNKYIKILPEATHLCIWEKSRHNLYNWTTEFIL